jgi:hypothetical protein
MTLRTDELPVELPKPTEAPCLSLYQPTHRRHPESQQDPIRFRNLVKELEQSLRQKYAKRETRSLLAPFDSLARDFDFWNHAQDGLAILRAPDLFRLYKLQRAVPEFAIVADTFHIKPLLRITQSADRYQVLGLSRGAVKLFEGNRDALDEIDLAPGVPRTVADALPDVATEPYQSVKPLGTVGGSNVAVHHGQGGKSDRVPVDVERFFRAVDRSILAHHSRPSGLPLLLAALPEYHGVFRGISHNPFLMDDGLRIDPDSISTDQLRELAWKIIEPRYQNRLNQLVDAFGQAKSKGLAGDHIGQIAFDTVSGRTMTLLVEANREIPGRIDPSNGRVEFLNISHPQINDLLDDLAELVLNKGGQVIVVPRERMPVETGAAAIYRY